MNIEDSVQLTNIDNNIVNQISSFRSKGEKRDKLEERILKSVMIYMCYNFQQMKYNLFNQAKIDPYEFEKVMGIDRTKLSRMHPSPLYVKLSNKSSEELYALQEKHGKYSEYRVWGTYLENALFTLTNTSLMQSYATKDSNGNRVTLSGFKYIEELQFSAIPENKTKRLIYYYTPSDKFEQNLITYYSLIHLPKWKAMTRKGFDDLYMYLMARVDQYNNTDDKNSILVKFEDLAYYCSVSTNTLEKGKKYAFSRIKHRVGEKINDDFIPEMKEYVDNLQFEWIKGTGTKFASVGKFTWRKESKNELEAIKKKRYQVLFYSELFKQLLSLYQKIDDPYEKDDKLLYNGFLKWMCSYKTFEEKKALYITLYINIRSHIPNIDKFAETFYQVFADLKELYDWKRFIYFDNNLFCLKRPDNDCKDVAIDSKSIIPIIEYLMRHKKHYLNANTELKAVIAKTENAKK